MIAAEYDEQRRIPVKRLRGRGRRPVCIFRRYSIHMTIKTETDLPG
jgi:hypothetical protein